MKTFTAITLSDDQTGSKARIVPELGFNCYSFEAVIDGQPCELLWSSPQLLMGTQKPSRSGIPILFPFAGRIRGTEFKFEGETYSVPAGDDFGNAIHGFVLNRPWRVVDHQPSRATAEFQASLDDPGILSHWPADFRVRVTYSLRQNTLAMGVEAFNPDNRTLPFWFGTHPYFRVPIVAGGSRDTCRVTVPAGSFWELNDMLPTGQVLPACGHRDLRVGPRFGQLQIDDILGDLQFQADVCAPRIDDPASGRSMSIRFGRAFTSCVVFTPPHREAVCIEPYTSVSNAFELEARGIKTGLRRLAPGEAFRASIEIALE